VKSTPSVREITRHLRGLGDADIAEHSLRFFKTGKGEYGEGDRFLGIRVPVVRQAVKRYREAPITVAEKLLASPWHEIRLFALLLLVSHFDKGSPEVQKHIYLLYLSNTRYINNWDLVDASAHRIVGVYLHVRERKVLYKLVRSASLWERRIAIMATFHFIRDHDFGDTLALSELLLTDREDLIHKAVGWMLREVGKRDKRAEDQFLDKHCATMPRIMLRYAIEKHSATERQRYLKAAT